MTPSAATWRKLCVDLPSAASTSGPPLGCSPVLPMSTATPTIRRRMSGSIGSSHRSNAHAPRAATGSSISRRRRQHSHQSAAILADRVSPPRRTGRGAESLSKNRSAPILPRRRRSIESYSGSWKSTRLLQDQKSIQQPKRDRRDYEQIHRRNAVSVIAQKGLPASMPSL